MDACHAFDLVTCVHGTHYMGDQLAVLTRAADWLTGDGLPVADLDLSSIRLADGGPAGPTSPLRCASPGSPRRRDSGTSAVPVATVSVSRTPISAPTTAAGPNYTSQPPSTRTTAGRPSDRQSQPPGGSASCVVPGWQHVPVTPLRIIKGDATRPQASGPKIIAHICNDLGGWGKGFVVAISRR